MHVRNFFGVPLACSILFMPIAANGIALSDSADCARARAETEKAQVALSEATRDADTKAAAYARCKEQRRACTREKGDLDKALRKKRDARAAYSYALAKQKQACGR